MIGRLLIAAIILVPTFYLIARLQRRRHLLQYVFLCRYPLIASGILLTLPLMATSWFEEFAANLFVVDMIGVAIISFLSVLAAWTSALSLGLLYITIPVRCRLRFLKPGRKNSTGRNPSAEDAVPLVPKESQKNPDEKDDLDPHPQDPPEVRKKKRQATNPFPGILNRFGFLLAALLAAPISLTVAFKCTGGAKAGVAGMAAGLLIAGAFRLFWIRTGEGTMARLVDRVPKGKTWGVLYQTLFLGYEQGEGRFRQLNGWAFMVLLVLSYIALVIIADPSHDGPLYNSVPALSFVLILLALACLFLSSLSLFLDVFRVPVLLLVFVISWAAYSIYGSDHEYRTTPSARSSRERFTAVDVATHWIDKHQKEVYPIPIFVTASGGGIKAAAWTTQVLAGIRSDQSMGDRFADSLMLLSTVSGGSVGAMYFVDGYREGRPPSLAEADRAARSARTSSLTAVAWGLAYPDLGRALFPLVVPPQRDRGWAIEERWRLNLKPGSPTLADWREDVIQGRRPVQIFNATIVESGHRMTISPIDTPKPDEVPKFVDPSELRFRARHDFRGLYPGRDLPISTAARLSATFPWVSPVSRIDVDGQDRFHIADGGYFDNEGLVTAIEFMNLALPVLKEKGGCKKVILIRILASSPGDQGEAGDDKGWLYSAAGPLITMLNVRTSSQTVRNNDALFDLQLYWQDQEVDIEEITFVLDYKASMSWHLTADEQKGIAARWDDAIRDSANEHPTKANGKSLKNLRALIGEKTSPQ